jgi:5-methylcytosine-specific restriction protein A
MPTYLLTWNPARFPWSGLADEARLLQRGKESIGRWSCGSSRSIRQGDRLFVIRQGKPPRGIVAAGWATSEVFVDDHWGPAKRRAESKAHYVEWRLETLLDRAAGQILGV